LSLNFKCLRSQPFSSSHNKLPFNLHFILFRTDDPE
jgi:hypothetical protein